MAVGTQSLAERYAAEFPLSGKFYEQARDLFPAGVTHDLRYLTPFPVYVDRALGAHKWDVDGHELIDFWSGHGAMLLGHSHPEVVQAVQQQMGRMTHPGACHESEIAWGEWVRKLIISAEKMRFVASGTEATLMALRLSRIYTGKPKVLKFAGHFHGWHDYLITASEPPFDGQITPGVPRDVGDITVVVPPNDPGAVDRALSEDPQIGCVILEATGGHFGAVPIRGEFLQALRDLTQKHGRLLIFDEVISGFRVHPGGAQGYYHVKPDLTTLAKILAGGLPGGCLAGRADILDILDFRKGKPKMKHPGTFNANPLSAAAGITTLKILSDGEACRLANERARSLRQKLNAMFQKAGFDWLAYGEFSAWMLLPSYQGQRSNDDSFIPYGGAYDKLNFVKDTRLVHAFRQGMLLHGVDLPGLGGMTMAAHSKTDVDQTVAAVAGTLKMLHNEDIYNEK